MPGKPVPYRWITELPIKAQKEIERNFLAVIEQITPSPSIFDATIDPALAASDTATHQYINLTELVANESWTGMFNVGVVQRADIAITEPLTVIDISGKGDLSLFGVSGYFPDASHLAWVWQTLSTNTTQQVFFYNLSIDGEVLVNGAGPITAIGCRFGSGVTDAGGTHNATLIDCKLVAWTFAGAGGIVILRTFYNCESTGNVSCGNLCTLVWVGGAIGTGGGSTLTISGSGVGVVQAAISAGLTISGSAAASIVVDNTGVVGGAVSVTNTVSQVVVNGQWSDVVFSGVGTDRQFSGSCASLDVTGPIYVKAQNTQNNFGRHVILRGASVRGDLHLPLAAGRLECIGLTDSLITANFDGAPAYSIDAASTRCLFVFGGARQAPLGTQTNAGTHIRIITESDDSLVTTLINSGGLQGPPGEPGPPGDDGPPGTPGANGASGTNGTNGTNGTQGAQGPPGENGAEGPEGPPGPKGDKGDAGSAGTNGTNGTNGATGAQGPPGDDGAEGPEGPPGPQGDAGVNGTNGTNGTQGAQGAQGPPGDDGAEGPEGPPGPPGPLPGAWNSYTPTLTQAGVAVTKTVNYAAFTDIGSTRFVQVDMTTTGAGTANGLILVGMPVGQAPNAPANVLIGAGRVQLGTSAVVDLGVAVQLEGVGTSPTVLFIDETATTVGPYGAIAQASPGVVNAFQTGDIVRFFCFYELA